MKKAKKILSIILTFAMVITMVLPVFAENYATSGTCGENVTWEFDVPTRTLTISGEGEITNNPWYSYQKIIKSVIIESGVTGLCTNAFEGCTALTNLVIGDTVTSIAHWSFQDCSSLTSVVIPDNVRVIEHSAFENCSSLIDITIGNNLKNISDNAFYGCYNLKNVYIKNLTNWCNISFAWYNNECDSNPLCYAKNLYLDGELIIDLIIPEDVTSINSYAFYNYNLLESVTIHENVNSISETAFRYCNSLSEINVDENNKNFKSIDGVLFSNNMIALLQYPAQKTDETYTISDDILIIKDYAFYNNKYLKNVKIPNTVATIGEYTFYDCDSLAQIIIPDEIVSIGDYAFGNGSNPDVYYSGTEEQWNSISIGSRNYFNHIHYNCTNPDGHYTLTKVINPSTCADEGYSEYTCPCGYTLVKDYTYLEHTPGEWIVSIEATCTTDGYKYQRCTACGKRLSEEAIPSTGHTAGEWQLIAPTCTESGLEGKCCTICGELLEGEIIAALGGSHTFSEWENVDNKNQRTCDTCGYVEYKSVLGDLNGDGYVSAKDAQLILHNIAGIFAFESESLVESADMNKDGKISAVDARMVLQLVAGLWEKEDYIIIPYEGYNIFEKNVSVKSGDVVEVTIQLNDNSCLSCLTLMPYFEESVFKIVESEAGSLGATVNASNGVTTMATSNSFESGTIYTFTLEALKTTDSTIGVTVIEACDAKFNDITVTSDIVKCTVKLDSMDVDEPAIPEVPCADGHTWGEWEAGTAATCAEYGTKVRTCTVCGGKEFTSTPTTAHNYTWYTISVATCETDGVMLGECSECEDVDVKATAKLGHNLVDGVCQRCGLSEENITEPDTPVTPDEPENGEFSFLIKEPSTTTIRHLDGIVLHANIEGNLPDGAYIKWTADNKNFDMEESADGRTLTITSKNDGDTTFYAIVYDADGEVITSDSITMTSKAGFFDKIGSFFRSLFGSTKIYEN